MFVRNSGLLEMQVDSPVPLILYRQSNRMPLFLDCPNKGQQDRFIYDKHFAVYNAIPILVRLMAELEAMSDDRLKIIIRNPLG